MKKQKLFSVFGLILLTQTLSAQSKMGTFSPTFRIEALAGPTLSISHGKFIDDHKAFNEITYSDADISGKISPIIFFTAGAQFRFTPGDSGLFSKLSATLGFAYVKRGFNHKYELDANHNGADIVDKMEYSEKYTVNDLSVPLTIRYGKKWFAELGVSFDHLLSASRKQKLTREVTGSAAYDGGFKTEEEESYKLDGSLLASTSTGFIVGLGHTFSDRVSLRITNHFFQKTFSESNNSLTVNPFANPTTATSNNDFKSYNLHLELIINLFKISKNK